MDAPGIAHEGIMAAEQLDSLQSRFTECRIVAFADISTRMILVTNTGAQADRMALDNLCSEASMLLNFDTGSSGESKALNLAIRRTQRETVVFLRSDAEPNDALISVCAPTVDIGKFIPEALVCLGKIALH